MSHPKVSVIILNWNGWRDTVECLQSLYRITYPNFNVIVLDNGSADCSIKKIEECCEATLRVHHVSLSHHISGGGGKISAYDCEKTQPSSVREGQTGDAGTEPALVLLSSETNLGFAEGNNVATRYAIHNFGPDYILLLNNDTVVHPRFLSELVEVAMKDPLLGFAGPLIYYYNRDKRKDVIFCAGAMLDMIRGESINRGFYEVDRGQYGELVQVDYVPGSCLLIKARVIDDIGLFDPAYFTYWEEADLCVRGRRSQYLSFYAPKSKIWHKEAASSTGGNRLYYTTRNRFWFMRKNASKAQYVASSMYFLFYKLWFLSGAFLYNRRYEELLALWKGVFDGFFTSMRRHRRLNRSYF